MEEKIDYTKKLMMKFWHLDEATSLVRNLNIGTTLDQKILNEFVEWRNIILNNTQVEHYGDEGEFKYIEDGALGFIAVEIKSFLVWALAKDIIIPQELKEIAQKYKTELNSVKQPTKMEMKKETDGYKERHALKREKVLGAALKAMANFSERCKKGGQFKGKAIVEVIEQEEDIASLVQDEHHEFILSQEKMIDLINKSIRLGK